MYFHHYKCRIALLFGIVLIGDMNFEKFASGEFSPELPDNLDDFINYMMECRGVPGMTVAVVQNKKTLLTKGYGHSNIAKKSPASSKTLFSIASLTKAFTTTLLGQILQENDLSWDTPIREILGEDFYFNDTLRTNKTTVGDLASHALGIPSHNYVRLAILKRQELTKRLRFLKATKDFRRSWSYNNLMYGLLSYTTETLGEQEWEDMMSERIFKPLDMKSSNFMHKVDLNKSDIATSYIEDEDDEHNLSPISNTLHSTWGILGGTGSIISNAEDMAMWLHFLLQEGVSLNGERIIDAEVVRETQTPVNIIPHTKSDVLYIRPSIPYTYEHGKYGYGWRIGYYRGYKMIVHTGSSWGFGALLTLIPDLNIGIYTGINGGDSGYHGRRLLHMYIIDMLFNGTSWIDKEFMCAFPKKAMLFDESSSTTRAHLESFTNDSEEFYDDEAYTFDKKSEYSDIRFEQFVGSYGNWGYGNVSVALNGDDLYIYYGEIGIWKLAKTQDLLFSAKAQGAIWALDMKQVLFSFDDSLKIVSSVMIPFDKNDPQMFYRDLSMENVPLPPNPNIGLPCNERSCGRVNSVFSYGLVVLGILSILISVFFSS